MFLYNTETIALVAAHKRSIHSFVSDATNQNILTDAEHFLASNKAGSPGILSISFWSFDAISLQDLDRRLVNITSV